MLEMNNFDLLNLNSVIPHLHPLSKSGALSPRGRYFVGKMSFFISSVYLEQFFTNVVFTIEMIKKIKKKNFSKLS